ncbi:MAG: hypothetical protein JWP53_914 [Conexibacter sp.]|nr:hypothetical protein [Conexibacter sp.]
MRERHRRLRAHDRRTGPDPGVAGLIYTILVAAFVTACLTLAGCGGGSTRATTSAAPAETVTSTTPAQGGAFLPAVDRDERTRLADDYGLVRPAAPQLREACGRAAEPTDWTVLCPTRTPGGRLAVGAVTGVSGRADDFSRGYELSLDSGALRAGGAPDPGHWTIAAGTSEAMHDQLTAYGHSAPLSHRRIRIGRVTVTRYREPDFGEFPGIYGGHIVYEWTQGRGVVQVSVHGTVHERVLRGLVVLLSRGPDPSPAP